MPKKNNSNKKKPNTTKDNYLKKPLIIMGVSLAVLVIATLTISILVYNNVINIPFINDIFINTGMKEIVYTDDTTATGENADKPVENNTTEAIDPGNDYTPPTFDADEYFENNTVNHSGYDVSHSQNLLTEADAYSLLTERGFSAFPILTNTDINTGYCDEIEINSYSSNIHPTYYTQYRSSNDVLWLITIVDDSLFAIPFSYNSINSTNLIYSESDTIISYVATESKFYINTPNTSVSTIKTIEVINAESLEAITF